MAAYLIADGDIFDVSIYCQALAQVSVNKVQVRCTVDPASTQTDADLAFTVDDFLHLALRALLSSAALYGGVTVRRFRGAGVRPRTTYYFLSQHAGDDTTGMLPPQICGLLNLASSTMGLRAQGRLYLPFIGNKYESADGTPEGTFYPPVMITLGQYFSTPFILPTGGPAEVTCSFGHFNATDNLFHSYDRYWAQDRWATQRRRSQYNIKNFSPGGNIVG